MPELMGGWGANCTDPHKEDAEPRNQLCAHPQGRHMVGTRLEGSPRRAGANRWWHPRKEGLHASVCRSHPCSVVIGTICLGLRGNLLGVVLPLSDSSCSASGAF